MIQVAHKNSKGVPIIKGTVGRAKVDPGVSEVAAEVAAEVVKEVSSNVPGMIIQFVVPTVAISLGVYCAWGAVVSIASAFVSNTGSTVIKVALASAAFSAGKHVVDDMMGVAKEDHAEKKLDMTAVNAGKNFDQQQASYINVDAWSGASKNSHKNQGNIHKNQGDIHQTNAQLAQQHKEFFSLKTLEELATPGNAAGAIVGLATFFIPFGYLAAASAIGAGIYAYNHYGDEEVVAAGADGHDTDGHLVAK